MPDALARCSECGKRHRFGSCDSMWKMMRRALAPTWWERLIDWLRGDRDAD